MFLLTPPGKLAEHFLSTRPFDVADGITFFAGGVTEIAQVGLGSDAAYFCGHLEASFPVISASK